MRHAARLRARLRRTAADTQRICPLSASDTAASQTATSSRSSAGTDNIAKMTDGRPAPASMQATCVFPDPGGGSNGWCAKGCRADHVGVRAQDVVHDVVHDVGSTTSSRRSRTGAQRRRGRSNRPGSSRPCARVCDPVGPSATPVAGTQSTDGRHQVSCGAVEVRRRPTDRGWDLPPEASKVRGQTGRSTIVP